MILIFLCWLWVSRNRVIAVAVVLRDRAKHEDDQRHGEGKHGEGQNEEDKLDRCTFDDGRAEVEHEERVLKLERVDARLHARCTLWPSRQTMSSISAHFLVLFPFSLSRAIEEGKHRCSMANVVRPGREKVRNMPNIKLVTKVSHRLRFTAARLGTCI